MPSRSARNQVEFRRPGTASMRTPSDCTMKPWMTSAPVTFTWMFLLTGTTASLSTDSRLMKSGTVFASFSSTRVESKLKPPFWSFG